MSAVIDHETGKALNTGAEYWATQINASWKKSVAAILATAQLVTQALRDVTLEELSPLLNFSTSTISYLDAIGNGSDRFLHHGEEKLPASWRTLAELNLLTDAQWTVAKTGGGKDGAPLLRPDVERKEVTRFRTYQSRGVKEPPPLPKGKYRVIYADPPWQYDFSKSDSREIENQYPPMTIEQICKLDVQDITAADCVLLLWATSPKLSEALKVIGAWGFMYKTCAVWDKQKIGMGYYFRQQHELLLVAIVGSPAVPDPETRPSSIFSAPRREHSAKPESVIQAIERMYPPTTETHIELFCRKERHNWMPWGNQVQAVS